MVCPVAWSKKGVSADVEVPTQQGTNLSVLGCMTYYGLIALSQQVPKPVDQKNVNLSVKDPAYPMVHILVTSYCLYVRCRLC
ncbi:hypothetical protein BDA99DRAFT_592957 [Phascolomyces articulosus]|uniref:Uncharacterized protein n=1 Tax=Phascolomyces articulosus TaxID=60185 RepID=A0AAD5PHC4_9FUNG|nr:hypothetical protein BDA99DRAFT_592957 [Phascolomyces articulosus]